jgi:hypothetical protein
MAIEIAADSDGLPVLDQFSEEGFVDCTFRISELRTDDATQRALLEASHRGRRVGFRAVIQRAIRAGFDADVQLIREHVCAGAVRFERTGLESDAMVSVLAELYGLEEATGPMAREVAFTGIVRARRAPS